MTDRSELIARAEGLKDDAKHESDEDVRARLMRMADHYIHLAESEARTGAQPVTIAALSDVFVKRD